MAVIEIYWLLRKREKNDNNSDIFNTIYSASVTVACHFSSESVRLGALTPVSRPVCM